MPFIGKKKEQLILQDRPAEGSAEGVSQEFSGNIGLPRLKLGLLVKPVIGHDVGGTMIFIGGTVKRICPTARDKGYLRS